MLLVAARWLRACASGWIALRSWGDAPADVAVYHGAGFEEFRREIGYQRDVE